MVFFDDGVNEGIVAPRQRALLKLWGEKTFTIRCPLPSGASQFRTYFRDTGAVACEGVELPYSALDPIAAFHSHPPS